VLFGSATPDELVKLAGTVLATEAVYTVDDGAWTGRASVTHRHRARLDANVVRQLGVGEAVIVSRGRAERLLVIPAPGSRNGEDRPPAAGTLHPAAPAGAVDGREVPPPALQRQGAAPAPRRPAGGLDPSGHSSVARKCPPAGGGDHPPDDREPQEAPHG